MSIFGRLVCTYCLLKDDMPFVSGSYVTEINDYIEKSGLFFFFFFFFFFFQKNGSDDFNLDVTEK